VQSEVSACVAQTHFLSRRLWHLLTEKDASAGRPAQTAIDAGEALLTLDQPRTLLHYRNNPTKFVFGLRTAQRVQNGCWSRPDLPPPLSIGASFSAGAVCFRNARAYEAGLAPGPRVAFGPVSHGALLVLSVIYRSARTSAKITI
jgi:hypothetical protein